jgi:hypothetical protein
MDTGSSVSLRRNSYTIIFIKKLEIVEENKVLIFSGHGLDSQIVQRTTQITHATQGISGTWTRKLSKPVQNISSSRYFKQTSQFSY